MFGIVLNLVGGTETEGIIKLQLEELSLAYEKINPYIASLKLQLSSLSALDLLQVCVN